MNKNLVKELDELKGAGVIDEETASRINSYYRDRSESSHNRLFVVFGVLGAILIGLGIILIIAHNWDDLSRAVKVFFSFLPLLAGQFFCGFSLLKRKESIAWREASATFLFFAVGSSISLVSQVYHIHGDLGSYLFTWMLLCLPLVYLLNSSIASLLYIVGITYYQCVTNFGIELFMHRQETFNYWWMLLLIGPHYYALYRRHPNSNYLLFHNWITPISLTISLGAVAHHNEELIFIAYMALFAIFYITGSSTYFNHSKRRINGYLVLGSLGTMHILLMMSFHWFWEKIAGQHFNLSDAINSQEGFASLLLVVLAVLLLLVSQRGKSWKELHPIKVTFLLYVFIFFIGLGNTPLPVVFINLLVLSLGIYTVWQGAKADHLGVLNYGLLTITALVICRFFDSDMSFVVRGILFVLVGTGFFAANYMMLKKRRFNQLGK